MLFERLLQELSQERANLEKMISCGQVEDFAAYKFLVGKVAGLSEAIDICKYTFRRYEDEESE
jgi:hypothetical protein